MSKYLKFSIVASAVAAVVLVSTIILVIVFACLNDVSAKKNAMKEYCICRVDYGSRVQSFTIENDTAFVAVEGRSDEITSTMLNFLDSVGLLNKQLLITKFHNQVYIENLPRPFSLLKIPLNGLRNPVVKVDIGGDLPLIVRPAMSFSLKVGSSGYIVTAVPRKK